MKVYPYFLKPATSLCRLSVFHSILWSRVALLFVVVSSVSLTFVSHAYAAPSPVPPLNTFTFYQNPGTYNYVIPPGVTSITVEVWGGGGRGGSRTTGTAGTGGGGGGAYSRRTVAVTPGQIYVVNVGVGSTSNTTPGGDTWVSPNTVGNALVLAKGGNSAANNVTTGATGGAAGSGIGDVRFSGGNGANAPSTTSSGGGGSSAGISANGTNASGTTGGVAPLNGGNGANGRTTAGSGTAGSLPGGGGSGAIRGTTGSPAGGAGAHGKVLINLTFDVNAGPDQTQCNNAMFQVSTNPPLAGYSFSWSVVSGTGFIYDNWSTNTQITVPAGSSATVRLSVTDGTTTITDDVVLTNTTSCTPSCVNPVNINGDLEQQGTANAYNLSFQGTPASVIFQNSNPVGWAERYGTATPNTTSFTGAYYLNKTGVNGDPHSGSKFIYMAGEGFCLSNLKTWQKISCGKTYRVSVWVAAYSNSGTQSSSPFAIEFNGGGPNVPSFAIAETLRAPASASWNNLNWQRYSFEFTIPSTGYEWGDFLFTTFDNVNGIVIDDMCVEEVFNGAHADAGPDQYKCDNSFTMSANTPASGFTGSWSVVSGSASVSNVSSPTSPVTLTSGNAARLRWTMTRSGTNTFYAINPEKEGGFESCCSPYDNGWTAVNNGTNNWVVGEGGGSTGGSQAAYISNNGGTSAAYNITTAQTSHLYRDVMVHPNATNINLQFDWQNMGQSGFDRLLVYTAPTSVNPVAGVPASSNTTLTGATLVSTLNLHSNQHFSNESITLPASLAGSTFRLIFTWQNNNSSGTNWLAAVVDNVSLSYTLTTCNDFDEVTIVNSTANSGLSVNNANICPLESATLTATGCNSGSLLWSTGATTNTITVSPAATTNYTVTCTPSVSSNLLTNGNFESATNLQGWSNWANASITTNTSHVYAGSKAVYLNGSVSYAGVAQGFATTPGQRFRVRFYAKTTNSNALPLVRYHVYDNISNVLDDGEGVHITSTNYQLYEFFVTTPPNTTWVTFFAETGDKGGLYVDNFEVVSINGCSSTAQATVNVGTSQCPTIFICDSKFYQTREINGDYHLTRIETKPSVSITNLANLTQNGVVDGINSIVFNKSDGFIYGLAMTAPFHLYRIGSNYVVRNLGIVQGFPSDAFVNAADIVNGNIIYRNANDEDLYQLNFTTLTVTKLCDFNFTVSPQSNVGDIAFNPVDGRLYGTRDNSRKLVQYNLNNCTFQEITLSDSIIAAHGAFFISADGVGYGYQNFTGKFTEINLSTGLVRTVGQDIQTTQTDGCSCDGIKFTKTVSVASTRTCNVFTYHFNFFNQWTGPVTNVSFRDTLLNNLTWASNPRNIQNISLGATSLIGTNTAVFTINSIPVGTSSFSIDVHVPQSYNGGNIYSNQAYIHNLPALLPSTKPSDNPLTAAIEDATPITINPTNLTISHSGNVSVCAGASANISTTTSGGTGSGYTYQWAPTTGLSAANIPNPVATPSVTTTYSVTVTDANGCTKTTSVTITILPNPTAPVVGTITQPTCTTPTGSVVLSGLPATGSWTITRTPGGTSYTGTGTSFTVTGLPVSNTYTFTVTNSNSCKSPASTNVIINAVPSNPTLGGATAVCVGSTANVSPNTSGTWTSSNNAIATITNGGVVTGLTSGTVTLIYTRTSDGCSNTTNFVVNSLPVATITGDNYICTGLSTTLTAAGGTSYIWQTGQNTSVITVSPTTATTYVVTVTNVNGCTNTASYLVQLYPTFTVNATSPTQNICAGQDLVLNGSMTNGVLRETYTGISGTLVSNLTSHSSYPSAPNVREIRTNTIGPSGVGENYGTRVRYYFTPQVSGDHQFVIYGDDETVLYWSGSDATSPLSILANVPGWTNEGELTRFASQTSALVNLTAGQQYYFELLHKEGGGGDHYGILYKLAADPGFINIPESTISPVKLSWTGPNNYTSTNVNNVITNTTTSHSGTYSLTGTDLFGCQVTSNVNITVNANPTAPVVGTITQPTCTTPTGSVVLSGLPATGSWTITRTPDGTTYTGTGTSFTVTGLPVSTTYTFSVTNSNTCTSPASANVTINAIPSNPTLGGGSAVCVGLTANVTPATGGTWTSSNTSIASITNAGLVTGVSAGSVTLTYTRTSDGCSNTRPFTVNANPTAPVVGTITQPTCTTPTGSVVLSGLPSTGSWTITRTPGGTTYTGTGTSFTITGLPVSTTYTFAVTNSNTCTSPTSANVTINAIPGAPTLGGASEVCVGSTANVTPATGGTWVSSNTSFATITNAGVVTGVASGSVTLTYTRTSDGCSSTLPFTVNANPSAPVVGTITQPTCTTPTGSVVLSGLPATASWTITRTPGGVTYNGSGSTFTITNLSPDNNFTFILTNVNGCSSPSSNVVNINSIPSIPTLGGDNMVCVGGTAIITPTTNGTWLSSNTSIATITNEGVITGISPGMVVLTYTRNSNGCSGTKEFTVYPIPNVPVIGAITQPNCAVPTGSVILNGLPATGNYTINQSPGGISYNASGSSFTINGLSPNTNYTFTVTSAQNCTSPASTSVNITGIPSSPSVSIDYNGSVCLEDNKELSAIVTGGIAPFTYLWNGPAGFTASTQTVVISTNGNYYLTVTDANLCTAVTSGFIYERYEPFVVSLQTRICEGQNVNLDVNSPSAVSYLWGSNAGNGTTKMVTVTPQVPSSTYLVTVTNDLGCTAVPQITIQVDPRPIVSITGSNIICQEQTTQLSPSTGGTWVSTNPGVATINNSGLVTGISAGTATFVFTSSTTNCVSHPSAPVTVHAKPVVVVTGPNPICIGQTTTLSPSTGGTWVSSNVSVATVNNSGIVTGISNGSVTLTYTNTSTFCVSNASTAVIVQNLPSATITGNGSVCESSNIILNASVPGGTWTSSNHAVAVINNSGIVSGISQGTVTITYQYGTGVCSGQVQKNIEVLEKPVITFTGDQTICVGQTTTLSSGQSGNWTSSNPMIATISQSGVVTGVSDGMATFTFENLVSGCFSDASEVLTVYEKPTVSLTGPSTICLGSTTQIMPSAGGVWTSSNPLVATITNNGVITSTGIGTTSFTFTDNLTGCSSDGNISVSVGASLSAAMDYHGSICLTDTSKLSAIPTGGTAAFTYQWVGPLGFTGNTQTIDINTNGNYFVTITDALGCKANLSGFVYQRFDPFIVNLSSSVCEGQSVNLSVNAPTAVSYLWSSNASNAVTSSVQVIPVLPSSAYFVTVTNNLGCKAVANASVLVNPKPIVNITGGNTICIGQTTTLTPSSGGSWVALHPSVATISQTGIVTGTGFGNAGFLFTNTSTGCTSDTSGVVSVHSSTNITFVGPSSVCAGDQTSVSPGSGGSWVSSNSSVATVNHAGVVVAVSPGVAQLTYTNNLGCTTNGSLSVTVHDKPTILLDGPSQVCVGATTRFLPSNGGTWTTSHASIASINNSGLVTGISEGTARFVYTNAFTGCKSDSSTTITILPRPVVQITGNNPICVGSSTTLSPNSGGMWMSSNPSVASVTNAGLVTGLGQGNVTFTFTNNTTGCSSLPTAPLTVNARPVVSVTGPNGICIGGTTTLSPSTGGTWTLVNSSVASVTNAGLVTGLAPGSSGFIFTNTSTGCVSNATNNVTVYGRPTVNINSTSICIGSTTTVTPSTGGVWTSSNPAVATVNGSGLVTGVSAGQVTFTFTENSTGCTSNPTSTLQVFGKPVVSITGPTNICVGQTTTLQPISGGAWSSLSPSVATVSNSGIVTGVGNGSAQFVFTSNQGCASDPSGNVTVNARPVVIITGLNPICIGTTTQLSPASGGTWVSSHPSIAFVNNAGLVTGMAAGGSRFVFTQTSTGCSSDSSSLITVNAPPVVNLLGSPSICIGQTSQVSPTVGGTWMSLNPTIATVSNGGLVTGVSAGQASFKFVQTSTGCENTLTNVVTVKPRPDISLSGPSQICIGATTQFTPTSGGTWTSLMTSVATINNSGLVTGINQGQATFRFTSASTGCTSLASAPVTVLGRPTVLLDGPNSICIGNNTQVLPNSGGSWVSTNPLVATVSLTGLVTGVAAGTAQFVFTEENTGCVSNPTTAITVFNGATVSLSGPSSICTGYNTTLSSSTSGVWYSTNPMIAEVSSNGMVTGIAPGKVSFYFQQSGTGCLSYLPDDILTVTQCIDADFNVTAVNVPLTGDVHTNDEVPVGTSYSTSPYLIGKPDGSLATLTMSQNGKYTFTANTPGEYIYNVPVCIPGMGSACPVSTLVITVVNPFSQNHNIITNLDITYTIQDKPVNFNAQVNDDCISSSGCMVDPQMITVIVPPNHGNAITLTDGSVLYTPASGFIGFDTLIYQVCATNNAGNCRSAQLIVTVMSSDASNSLAAADDFYAIPKGGVVSDANVLFNDFDPEGGKISIIPQGSVQNPVVSVAGSYYINSEGVLHFEASPTFTGPFDIVYTICDSVSFCVSATTHILVVDNMKLRIRAYLEGALMENKDAVSSTGRPLMRDDLRNNKFTNSNLIPSIDPYSNPVGYIDIRHNFQHVGLANNSMFTTIQNPQSVFAVTGENAIVDWVFIELRSKENYGEVIGTRSALIQRDGDVVDLDGVSFVEFPGLNVDSCYVVLKHRNHLGVMSLKIATGDLVDFTSPSTPVFDYGTGKNDGYDYTGLAQKADVALGYMSLWAGDFDGSGKIKFVNPDDDQNFLFIEVLFYPSNTDFVANYNFVHGYLQGDYDLNGKSKYDNPDDDKNMLFYQVLFHPLNTNYTSNFNFITEQVPPKNIN